MTNITDETLNTTSTLYTSIGLVPADEMSAILKVSSQTLATWRCKGRGPPAIKLGKRVFYLLAEFNKWMMDEVKTQRSEKIVADSGERNFGTQLDMESYLQG